MSYGHALALLEKCSRGCDRRGIALDANDKRICAVCACKDEGVSTEGLEDL